MIIMSFYRNWAFISVSIFLCSVYRTNILYKWFIMIVIIEICERRQKTIQIEIGNNNNRTDCASSCVFCLCIHYIYNICSIHIFIHSHLSHSEALLIFQHWTPTPILQRSEYIQYWLKFKWNNSLGPLNFSKRLANEFRIFRGPVKRLARSTYCPYRILWQFCDSFVTFLWHVQIYVHHFLSPIFRFS